jgi:Mg-chelatase subunit ChlD
MKIQKLKQDSLQSRLSALKGLKQIEKNLGRPLRSPPQIIYMLIDCSGSMEGEKLQAAKHGAIRFAKEAQEHSHSIGLISFDSEASHRLEPVRTLERVEQQVNSLIATGSTNLAAAIEVAFGLLKVTRGERLMYVITDGMPDDVESALAAAERAKRVGIKIMTLGTDDADRNFLAKLSSRPEMSVKVPRAELQEGVASMVKLLGN